MPHRENPSFQYLVLNGFSEHFIQGRHAGLDFEKAAGTKCDHSFLNGFPLDFSRRSTDQNELLNLFVNLHYFVQAHTTLVSRAAAGPAPFALESLDVLGFFRSEA